MEETINEIIYLSWVGQISSDEMRQRLAEVPAAELASWIDDAVNRTNAMNLAISNCRMKYQDKPIALPDLPMDDRIRQAAQCFCHDESVRCWRTDTSMRAVMNGLCQAHEYYAFEKRARELQNQP